MEQPAACTAAACPQTPAPQPPARKPHRPQREPCATCGVRVQLGAMARPNLFASVGEAAIRAVLTDFYQSVFGDVMIGFLFEGVDRTQLIEREYQFTARFLGAEVEYTGRPMRAAHQRLRVFGGHFERRQHLLRAALAKHQIPSDVQAAWLGHHEALRAQITADKGSECKDSSAQWMEDDRATVVEPIEHNRENKHGRNAEGLVRLGRK